MPHSPGIHESTKATYPATGFNTCQRTPPQASTPVNVPRHRLQHLSTYPATGFNAQRRGSPGGGGGGGGKGGNCPPTFCLNGMDMPVAPPPKIWQSRGISTLLPPPPPRKKSFPRPCQHLSPLKQGQSQLCHTGVKLRDL